jgi:hypothetical protein
MIAWAEVAHSQCALASVDDANGVELQLVK